jgi:hypothetical protein
MGAQALENQGYRHTLLYLFTKIPTNNRIEKHISARTGPSSSPLSDSPCQRPEAIQY